MYRQCRDCMEWRRVQGSWKCRCVVHIFKSYSNAALHSVIIIAIISFFCTFEMCKSLFCLSAQKKKVFRNPHNHFLESRLCVKRHKPAAQYFSCEVFGFFWGLVLFYNRYFAQFPAVTLTVHLHWCASLCSHFPSCSSEVFEASTDLAQPVVLESFDSH